MNRLLLGLLTLLHLVPHPFGVSPVGAIALYAGAYGPNRMSWAVPLLPLLVANLWYGFYEPWVLLFVYAGFASSTFAGRLFLRRARNKTRFGAAITLGAAIFFVVSNFGVWLAGMYPQSLAGLLQCYINGLPYLGQAIISDAAYCCAIFGMHRLARQYQPLTVAA